MLKRRRLEVNQPVLIIFDCRLGYVEEKAVFRRYDRIMYAEGVSHETPVFAYKNGEITGLDCFWLLPDDADTPEKIQKFQKELIPLQIVALEIAQELDYKMPMKVKDSEISQIASKNTERMQALITKFGFDPRDESWIEQDMAVNDRERHWFAFERENAVIFTGAWASVVEMFNSRFNDTLTIEEAQNISKKRMRYILGAYNTRLIGNADHNDWKQAAREFEKFHRERENRMLTWSLMHQGHFPLVRTKKEVLFWHGPYFNECIERIPHVFTNPTCRYLKSGIVLRVISYDRETKYIRLDFTEDVRKILKPDETDVKPWVKDRPDYDVWLRPEEIETHLDVLESLE